jgi:hypothetical protein
MQGQYPGAGDLSGVRKIANALLSGTAIIESATTLFDELDLETFPLEPQTM